ncbi:MAG: UDP-N-acetylmuramate dehydrogenase, partial [Bacillota bacterium]
AKMRELTLQRESKQPLDMPSAGSTFKRPPGKFVGPLIEQAGLKGFVLGGAQVSEKHAGFVINAGGATASDILGLISHVQKTVKEQFDVDLFPEVKVIGE